MTRDRWAGVFATSVACAVLSAGPVSAKLTPQQRCASEKLTAQANYVNATMKCYSKTKFTAPVDPACVQKASDKLTKAFTSAEKPGACKVNGDAHEIAALADMLVQEVVQAVEPPAGGAATKPEQKCAVTKATAASKQAKETTRCHQQSLSLASLALLALCRDQAGDKLETTFAKAEAPGACATTGDAAAVKGVVDHRLRDIAVALVPPPPTPTPIPGPTPVPCTGAFQDNGNGTITDCATKLMWEKKDRSGSLEDQDNFYLWSGVCSISSDLCVYTSVAESLCNTATGGVYGCAQCPPGAGNCNGVYITIWQFLAALNGNNFAGHSDWRIPTLAELQTIVASPCPGGGQPCVPSAFNNGCMPGCSVTTCSCTVTGGTWSGSTYSGDPGFAWYVGFFGGNTNFSSKTGNGYVRAVRGGL